MSKPYKVEISEATAKGKKKKAVFYDKDGKKIKTVQFGAEGMSDFTKHKDTDRRDRYDARHKPNQNWNDPMTAGALSKYILWNKPSLSASISDYKRKFNLK